MKDKLKEIAENMFDSREKEYKREWVRIPRVKSAFLFAGSLFIFIMLVILGFRINIVYMSVFVVNLIVLIVNGINLFTKKGISLPKTIEVEKDDEDEE